MGRGIGLLAGAFVGIGALHTEARALPSREWGTYYGGSAGEIVRDVEFAGSLDVFVVGHSNSTSGIATLGSHDNQLSGIEDAFIAMFDHTGAQVWGTYYGGLGSDRFNRLVTDADDGMLYAAGSTDSQGFIVTLGAHQITLGGLKDGMLVKFDISGARQWGTYFGGPDQDWGWGTCLAPNGSVYLVGATRSSSGIATTGAHDTTLNDFEDAFVAKFLADGTLSWATYYGDASGTTTVAVDCAVDSANNVYVTGFTDASSGIASGGHDNVFDGVQNAFLVKFNNSGVRQWATYYGGTGATFAYTVEVDSSNNVYVAGETTSTSTIATAGAHDTVLTDNKDAFVVKFNSSGTRQWGTYFGGDNGLGSSNVFEQFNALKISGSSLYLTGRTDSVNGIATTGAWRSTNAAGDLADMFINMSTAGVVLYGSYNGGLVDTEGQQPGVAVSPQGRAAAVGTTLTTTGVATTGTHDTTHNGSFDGFITYIHLFDI